ncbi:MAG: sigma-70 family RNA polymerase sigma factor [Myxococcales bacterium]|nr:sigma-70 family RNA polymerase sigma factor [Myxococcales bacterium]
MPDAVRKPAYAPVDGPTDEELFRAYVHGDDAAFRVLFERYLPILMRLTIRSLRSEEMAREITQQAMFQAHNARFDFDLSRKFKPWIFTIAMNLVREHFRRAKRRRQSAIDPADLASPDHEKPLPMEVDDRKRALREALEQLPPNQREVVELHWFQELPFAQVAEIVGASEGAVRVRAHRGYKSLKSLLEQSLRNNSGGRP